MSLPPLCIKPLVSNHWPLLSTLAKGLLLACLLHSALLMTACTPVKDDDNLTGLEQKSIKIKDEKVNSGLEKAMQSYRKYLQQAANSEKKPEAMRRLADLEIATSYDIPGPGSPAEAGAKAAIKHYTKLLADYPMYDYSDHVLYQLSRAYKEVGDSAQSIASLQQLTENYPEFEHIDEVNFRLGEYYFRQNQYIKASKAYTATLAKGKSSVFYSAALNKQGWSYFKQDDYNQALKYFIATLDLLVEQGYHPDNKDSTDKYKNLADNYHAISLNFAYLDGAKAITRFIKENGNKSYEAELYRSLAEYYFSKNRYSDAANSYQSYIESYPYADKSPGFVIRIIEIYQLGNFIDLAIKTRTEFALRYDKRNQHWKKLSPAIQTAVDKFQKENIYILASFFHDSYKKILQKKEKKHNYTQASHWYSEYFYLYPEDERSPTMSQRLAELHLENTDYRAAAVAFERTAYNYPAAKIAAESGYAAIFAYREHLKLQTVSRQSKIREEVVSSSLLFVENFPQHAEAAGVLTAAANDLLLLKNYSAAANSARRVVTRYKNADNRLLRSAWLIIGDASFESAHYESAEKAYHQALKMTADDNKNRTSLMKNLAASIYKQGELARRHGRHNIAAKHFLRIQTAAPGVQLPNPVQYDAAVELVAAEDWYRAASVLEDFRKQNPVHKLAAVTSRNLAIIYKNNDELLKSAAEFERIEKNNKNRTIRRDALLQAAELYREAEKTSETLRIYQRYVKLFPTPVEDAIESYQHIAEIYRSRNDKNNYHKYLNKIISTDEKAGRERTDRTQQLASQALLVLAEVKMDTFKNVKLIKPFKKNLTLKKQYMATTIDILNRLLKYKISDVTTAATFYLAEIYLHFSQVLSGSERPAGLNTLEYEQYELALEEQVYQFEEKAINIHEKNTELLDAGIYDPWVVKSINRLAELLPARYAKQEQNSGYLQNLYAQDDRL